MGLRYVRPVVGVGLLLWACSGEKSDRTPPAQSGGTSSGGRGGVGNVAGASNGGTSNAAGTRAQGGAGAGGDGMAGSTGGARAGEGGDSPTAGEGGVSGSGGESGGAPGGQGGESGEASGGQGGEHTCLPVTCDDATALDEDGDGLNDDWERAGGNDVDCDGTVEPGERALANVDPTFPDGSPNATPSADPSVKDIFVAYDFMVLPDDGNPCVVAPISGAPLYSPDCALDQYCISDICRGHSDAPSPAALQMVVEAFAAHGIRLHLATAHPAGIPHAKVVSFGPVILDCSADSAALDGARRHLNFYDAKLANFDAVNRAGFHYVIFGHHHSCDSIADCAKAVCLLPDTGYQPLFTETGVSEIAGNDSIISMGRLRDRDFPPTVINEAGTFMHELGHNLGLDHGGPALNGPEAHINFKPNYISVMNYAFQSSGIGTAATPGSTVAISTRVDYSNAALPTLDESSLDENVGIGAGNDISYTFCPDKKPVPGTGPVDWNCSNSTETGLAAEINNDGVQSVLVGHSDWDQLYFKFQCNSQFND